MTPEKGTPESRVLWLGRLERAAVAYRESCEYVDSLELAESGKRWEAIELRLAARVSLEAVAYEGW